MFKKCLKNIFKNVIYYYHSRHSYITNLRYGVLQQRTYTTGVGVVPDG